MTADYDIHCELEAVKAIFPEIVGEDSTANCITVKCGGGLLCVSIAGGLIGKAPKFEIGAPLLGVIPKRKLLEKLNAICEERQDEPMLYYIVEAILFFWENERAKSKFGNTPELAEEETFNSSPASSSASSSDSCYTNRRRKRSSGDIPSISSGRVFEDRKSVFQAHVALISSKEDALRVLLRLKENTKIARATHNIYAYRVAKTLAGGRVIDQQDCDCDGETGAGPKLLKLLHLMKAMNMIVIVTRWYGGIHLGPDRFRHISNLAREVILDGQRSLLGGQ